MIQQYSFRILLYLKYPEIGYFKILRLYGNIIGTKNMFNISVAILSWKYIKHILSLNTSHRILYGGLLLTPADCFSSWHEISVNEKPTRKLPYWPWFKTVLHCFTKICDHQTETSLYHWSPLCQLYCIPISLNHCNLV